MSRNVPRDRALSDSDREYLQARGRQDLVESIDRNNPMADDPNDSDDPNPEPESVDQYDDADVWTYRALQEEAGQRDLPKSGSREELIARLRANDAGE